MTIYTGFAPFYDRIMGDRTEEVDRIRSYISRHLPDARSLLELGCGTGALLAGLAGDLDVSGIDQSPQMLAIAQTAVPGAHLVRGDMTAFTLPAQFDVVICMFDTLNHVPSFAGWLSLFSCVHEHLAAGGLFIFDVNTAGRLRRLDDAPPFVDEFDGNLVIMTVRPAHDGLSLWETRIFDRQHDDIYRLHHERIYELGVPLAVIRASLAGRFDLLEEASLDGSAVSDESDRVYFAYRHRGGDHAVTGQ
ncbi:MAG TPA: class I SAM-dependent methyltransferase [Streptosporangiaceae bacterium]|jgi:SAM-dependent methyltransferase